MSCGATLGHGIFCVGSEGDPYLCEKCKLQFENRDLRREVERLKDQAQCGHGTACEDCGFMPPEAARP